MRERGGNQGNAMSNRIVIAALALAELAVTCPGAVIAAKAQPALTGELRLAQLESPPRTVRTRPRIEVYPGRPLHRECVDGYREVWRPYWGTSVVMPYMRCWWVRG